MSGMRKIMALAGIVGVLAGCSTEPDRPSEVVYEVGGDIGFAGYTDGLSSDKEFDPTNRVVLTGELIPESTLYVYAAPKSRHSEAWCKITSNGQTLAYEKVKGSSNYATCIGDI